MHPNRPLLAKILCCATLAAVTTSFRPAALASAAEYAAQTVAVLRLSDVNGAPLSGAFDATFVEAEARAESSGPAKAFTHADVTVDDVGGFVDGFGAVVGVAGAGAGASSQVDMRWLGGVEVHSPTSRSIAVNLSFFSVIAGKASTPEEVANAGVTLDLVVGRLDPTCAAGGPVARGVGADCFDLIVRIPIDDVTGVALPNFLAYTPLPRDASVNLVIDGAPSATPAFSGAERQEVVDIAAGVPVLIGLEATALGDAEDTGQPHCFGAVATLIGTDGADKLRGTPGDDVIMGLGGDDKINAKAGDDRICGGDGNDHIVGYKDDDLIAGEEGNDKIDGYYGDDVIVGGPGDDFIQGCDGDDLIDGGEGDDTLRGERGDDVLRGGPGDDNIKGAAGADVAIGGQDVQIVIAITVDDVGGPVSIDFARLNDSDDDRVNGDRSNDIVYGGPGNDVVKGGRGDDVVDGGSGHDECHDAAGTEFTECELYRTR